MKPFTRQLLFSLICTLTFSVAFTPATYAVDGCSPAGFKVATSIVLESPPFGVASADFNGDGHLDLVAVPNNSSLSNVIVLYGRGGTEKFGPPTDFPVGARAETVDVADINGDGKPDLVATLDSFAQPLGRLSILLNDGTGRFGAPKIVSMQGDPHRPVFADVNNDGKLDIATGLFTGSNDGRVAVLLGDGAGGFSQAPNSPFSTLSRNSGAVVIGDFNEDGKRDLAVPGSLSGVDILLGDGTGAFATGVNINPNGTSTFFLTSGDFNGDGHLDLLSDFRIVLGTGTGSFSAPIVVDLPDNTHSALARDLNNDGHLDLVAGTNSGLTIMLGNGTGNLVRGKSYVSAVADFGDFNEDGKLDIAGINTTGIAILDGDGTGAFNDALSYQTSISGMRNLVAADFNNDGKQDFAIIGPSLGQVPGGGGRVEVALGDGTGGFTRKSISNFGFAIPVGITTADFNDDGKFDLAVTTPTNGRVSVLLNDGTGGFPTDGAAAPFVSVGFLPSAIKAGDINNDSKIDLIVIRRGADSYVVLLASGGGVFTDIGGGPIPTTPFAFNFSDDLATGDFNADGKLDFAVARSSESFVSVFSGNGTSQFSNYATVDIPGIALSIFVKDLNGDGKDDIAASNSEFSSNGQQQYVSVATNNGAQGFNAATNYPTDGAGVVGVGDFNSDSKRDLAVSSGRISVGAILDGIAVLTNKGNGEFNAAVNFPTGPVSDYLVVADFNNDGKDDVVVSHFLGSVAALLNNFTGSLPCLSINDVTVTETDTGTANATFTVKLSAASAQTVKVNYFASQVFLLTTSATPGADFDNVSGTLTFLPGETTQTLTIPVKGDLIDEIDQLFSVTLTTPINALISDGKGTGTILDNDSPPAISINDATVTEGNGFPQQSATFTVSVNVPSEKTITVDVALAAGTATANIDFFPFSFPMEIPAGTGTGTITVSIIGDNVFELDETFFVNLSNATNATIADAQGQATITNDDPQPGISIAVSAFRAEGSASTNSNATFEVKLSNPSHQTITVAYATANGTATAGADYTATSGAVTFNPGETTRSVAVEVIGDNIDETNETFFVNLSNATNASIANAQGVGTILDDDGPTVSINSVSVNEGQAGFTNAVFTVTLSGPTVQEVLVNYVTAGNTATSNVDFQRIFGLTLLIPAGSTSGTITVRVFGDLAIEPDEQFFVNLQNATNATIANGQGTGTIVNDDSAGKLQFSNQTYNTTEDAGSMLITVTRVDGATGSVSVNYATSNGTATAGSDYTAASGTLTFIHGETSQSFSIPITNDSVFEPDETVNLTLSNPTGDATLGTPATATLTIKPPPLLIVLDESGPGSHQATALDSLFLLRDPFPVISPFNFFNSGSDRNTRVIVFVANLQLAPGDVASSIKVNLFDSNAQSHDLDAEDMRVIPVANFMQVTFRLPDSVRPGVCVIKIKGPHDQESNSATMRIKE